MTTPLPMKTNSTSSSSRASSQSSPYFKAPSSSTIGNNNNESKHFSSSQSSAVQSVATVGLFLDTLVYDTSPSSSVEVVAAGAANLFMCCPIFAERYHTLMSIYGTANVDTQSKRKRRREKYKQCSHNNVKAAGAIIEHSVRHLCNHGCFFSAFAPVREWHGLREAVRALSGCPPDRILKDWRCIVCRRQEEDNKSKFNTTDFVVQFISPDGKRFGSAADVLKELNCTTDATTSRKVKKSRISATTRSLSTLRSSASSDKCRMSKAAELAPRAAVHRRLSTAFDNADDLPHELKLHPAWSPFGLLEELFAEDPWRLLLSTILLNRTTRRQVDSVLHDFLVRWPTAEDAAAAEASDILNVVTPLGIRYKRSNGVIRFSKEYVQLVNQKISRHFVESAEPSGIGCGSKEITAAATKLEDGDILALYGCGKYALSAYKIFICRKLDIAVHDHALYYYVDYKRASLE